MNPADDVFVWKCPAVLLFSRQPDQAIESPRFQGGKVLDDTEWVFSFYPRGDDQPDHISLFIKRVDDSKGPTSFRAKYRLCLVDVDEVENYSSTCEHTFLTGTAHGVKKMAARKDLLGDLFTLMPGKNIIFKCYLRRINSNERHPTHTMTRTRINVEEVNCTWPIENFLKVSQVKKAVINLSTNSKRDFLEVSCYPSQESKLLNISFRLSDTTKNSFVRIRICVLDKSKKVRVTKNGEHAFEKVEDVCTQSMELHQKLEDFVLDGVLSIRLHFRISDGEMHSYVEAILTPLTERAVDGGTTLKQDLLKQSESVLFPDIRLQVDGENFFTHKSLLAVRSTEFERKLEEMEEHKMETGVDAREDDSGVENAGTNSEVTIEATASSTQEQETIQSEDTQVTKPQANDLVQAKEAMLVIDDIDKDTLKHVLKFLYSDSLDDTLDFEARHRLYSAAVKYDIQLLKEKCLKKMHSQITRDNAVRALILSDETQDKNLRKAAVNKIFEHKTDVLASNEWLALEHRNKKLTKAVLDRLHEKTKSEFEYWS